MKTKSFWDINALQRDLISELAEKIRKDIDAEISFTLLYGQKITINKKEYIIYNEYIPFINSDYDYIKIKCKLRKK